MTEIELVPFSLPVHGRLIWKWAHEDLHANASDDGHPPTYAAHEAHLAQRLRDEIMWCIEIDGQPVGCLGIRRDVEGIGSGTTWLHGLMVTQAMQRRGIASAAVHQVCAVLKKMGQQRLISLPFADNLPMQHLLESLGGHREPCDVVVCRHGQRVSLARWCVPIGNE